MLRKLVLTLVALTVLPLLSYAQDGKIRGTVRDRESGEPLVGANVLVEGTALGAATDVNGEYIILSVPPGVYTLKVSMVGYAPLTVSNVRVNANITTTQDFRISSSAVQLQAVEITAERPIVQRNTTNTVRLTTQEDIQNLPIRGLQNIVALQPGVVQQNGQLYVRGGRQGEVSYAVDGANVTNPVFNSANVGIIQEAIEEFQLQAGGYTAEFGGSNSGIIRTTLRTGGPDFSGSLDFRTDDFAKPGKQFLGTSSFGYRNVVATVSGPILPELRFFIAAQHNYLRDRQQRFITPFFFDSLRTDANDPQPGRLLPGPVFMKENSIPNNWAEANSVQGTLLYEFNPFKIRLTGSYQAETNPVDGGAAGGQRSGNVGQIITSEGSGGWPVYLQAYFNQQRKRIDRTRSGLGSIRFTHLVDPTTFYEISVSYQKRTFSREDPDFGSDWKSYVDSVKNAEKGYTNFTGYYQGPLQYSVINGFRFDAPGTPNNTYSKNEQQAWGFQADLTRQMNPEWELKVGGRLDLWTTRNYNVGNIQQAMVFLNGTDGKTPRTFSSPEERRVLLAQRGVINHYGYDVDGNEVNDGIDAPKKPVFASAYVQNKFEYKDLVVNVGLRFEHYNTKSKTFPDPLQLADPVRYAELFNTTLDVIDESKLVDQKPISYVLPRVSFSFPVTDKTVFYAMYGLYAQMPSLNQLYVGNTVLSRTVSVNTRGNAYLTPVGFLLRPERTTQYEVGFRQALTDNLAFTLTGFYKDLKDQLAVRMLISPNGTRVFTAYLNEDFGTVKGLELTLELRRTHRFAARVNYTLSDALGTGSNPRSGFGAIEQNIGRPSNFINALEFNQTHRGSVLLDYRFGKDDGGPVLSGIGINALLTFNSGHNFTKIKEPAELGQSNPWNVGVLPLIDPRSSFPTEPVNASTTPWVFNVDLSVSKMFYLGSVNLELYVNVLNLFNTKHVLNVYPTTGTPEDDGWLNSPLAVSFAADPLYSAFYRAINLENRWAYTTATGNDIYGTPRQIRVGARLEL